MPAFRNIGNAPGIQTLNGFTLQFQTEGIDDLNFNGFKHNMLSFWSMNVAGCLQGKGTDFGICFLATFLSIKYPAPALIFNLSPDSNR